MPRRLSQVLMSFFVSARSSRRISRLKRRLGCEPLEERRLLSAVPEPVLVRDIRPQPISSDPTRVVAAGDYGYFMAGQLGKSLFRLPDMQPVLGTFGVNGATHFNGEFVFVEANGGSLVLVEGNTGSHRVLRPDSSGLGALAPGGPQIAVVGSTLYLSGSAGFGWELWKSDGTASGTAQVADMVPGDGSFFPANLLAFQGQLYFTADDGRHGRELWKSDGTASGTLLVVDLAPGSQSSTPGELTVIGDSLYWSATNGTTGLELWRTDGTASGTSLVRDIWPGSTPSSPSAIRNVAGQLFFLADDGLHGQELWTSDGSPSGTRLVRDIYPGPEGALISELTPHGNELFFRAYEPESGAELWVSDGTSAGTRLVTDLVAGSLGSYPSALQPFGGRLYYAANDEESGYELWRTQGTALSTQLVRDIEPGSESSRPRDLATFGDRLYFSANTSGAGRELWHSDGSSSGTMLVRDFTPGGAGSYPDGLFNFAGRLFFSAYGPDSDREPWLSDGTSAGTQLLRNLNLANASNPQPLGMIGTTLYFSARGSQGGELWRTDGTSAGTTRVATVQPGAAFASWTYPTVIDDTLYFVTQNASIGESLWRSDGTSAGTRRVWESTGSIRDLTDVAGTLYFISTEPLTAAELWSSDGTSSGTRLAFSVRPGPPVNSLSRLTASGGSLYFSTIAVEGREIWRLDPASGTPQPLSGGQLSSNHFVELNGLMYFVARRAGERVSQLWRSDGTPEGTAPVAQTELAGLSIRPYLEVAGGRLFFVGVSEAGTEQLWRLDGTSSETIKLGEFGRINDDYLDWIFAIDRRVFFFASSGSDLHVWESDGTPLGTHLAIDQNGQPSGDVSDPQYATVVGNSLFFAGTDPRIDRDEELYRFTPRALPRLGDANGDGLVGAPDYALWAAQFGQTGVDLSADFDRSGDVGLADYAIWAAQRSVETGVARLAAPAALSANMGARVTPALAPKNLAPLDEVPAQPLSTEARPTLPTESVGEKFDTLWRQATGGTSSRPKPPPGAMGSVRAVDLVVTATPEWRPNLYLARTVTLPRDLGRPKR